MVSVIVVSDIRFHTLGHNYRVIRRISMGLSALRHEKHRGYGYRIGILEFISTPQYGVYKEYSSDYSGLVFCSTNGVGWEILKFEYLDRSYFFSIILSGTMSGIE